MSIVMVAPFKAKSEEKAVGAHVFQVGLAVAGPEQ